jgi:hypothetical protein
VWFDETDPLRLTALIQAFARDVAAQL